MTKQSSLIDAARTHDTFTDNGAITHSTSLNNVVDLFFIAGASRTMPERDIEKMLTKAWTVDPLLTLKVIFWAGNIRGGAGERRFFKTALNWMQYDKETLKGLEKNIVLVPHFNRWDSLFHLEFDLILDLIVNGLEEKNGLLAKWLPRGNKHNNLAYQLRKSMGLTPKQYRKLIVGLSKTVEQQMCAKEWGAITYSHVPSVAMHKYRTAFFRNDETRFKTFIEKVNDGEEKINASAIFPYQLYEAVHRGDDTQAIIAQWNAMPNYMEHTTERILPVCDVSGSMSGLPMSISVSLGVYLSERNVGIFKDAFVTFSGDPKLEYLKGNVVQRIKQIDSSNAGYNTDLDKTFEMILTKAREKKVPQNEMPTMLLIISDMEFDGGQVHMTNHENISAKYKAAGYTCPKLVYWNVNGRMGNVPVTCSQKKVALVSGASPAVIKGVLTGKDFTPVGIMLETLNNEIYDVIKF